MNCQADNNDFSDTSISDKSKRLSSQILGWGFSLVLLMSVTFCSAQNMVVNGGFEGVLPMNCGGSPDVHTNGGGYFGIDEIAYSGSKFAGIHPTIGNPSATAERFGLQLNQMLIPGTTYQLTFAVAIGRLELVSWYPPWNASDRGNKPGYVEINSGSTSCPVGQLLFTSSVVNDQSVGWVTQSTIFTVSQLTSRLAVRALGLGVGDNTPYVLVDDFCITTLGGSGCVSILPIDLISFNAKVEGDRVKTNWSTASELNNDYFTVQKSRNGQDFEELGTIPGAGNSNAQLDYGFYDNAPHPGLSYYRLKQTDFDGQTSYSGIVPVQVDGVGDIVVYPNPVRDILNVQLSSSEFAAKVEVIDPHGRFVHVESKLQASANKVLQLETGLFPPGVYLVRVTGSNGQVQSRRFLKA